MCLELPLFNKEKVAKEDIVCYKYVDIRSNLIFTTFHRAIVEIGKTYESKLIKSKYYWLFGFMPYSYIGDGLHTFKTYYGCLASFINTALETTKIVKCVIPAGSKYYEGTFDGQKSYASDKLTYVELYK